MVTRFSKDPPPPTAIQCFVPSFPPQLRLYPPVPNRGEQIYPMSGGPAAGPGMRAMHHQQPQQPPTPPIQQDMKQPPTLMQLPPQQQQPQQQGQQQIAFQMNQRQGGPRAGYFQQGPAASSRPPPRPNIMINQGQQFMPSQQVYAGGIPAMGQPAQSLPMMMPPYNMANPAGTRQIIFNPNQYSNNYYPYPMFQQVVRPPVTQLQNSQIMLQQPSQAVQPGVIGQPSEMPSTGTRKKLRPNAIKILDPNDGHDVLEAMKKEEEEPPGSGESSARETPQLAENRLVASEFARKVASTLGDEAVVRPGSRSSTYSESEPQTDIQPNVPRENMTSPKMDGSSDVVTVPSIVPETALVENNLAYGPEQAVPRWVPPMSVPVPLEHMGVSVPMHPPPLMVIPHDEMMRPAMHPPPREFQGWQQEPPPGASVTNIVPGIGPGLGMPVGVPGGVPTTAPPVLTPIPAMVKKPEHTTPVVSALAHGPTVDISREYPALGVQRHGAHQSPGRSKRRPGPGPTRPEPEPVESVTPTPPAAAPPQPATIPPQTVAVLAPAVVAQTPAPVPVATSAPVPELPKVPSPVSSITPVPSPTPVEEPAQCEPPAPQLPRQASPTPVISDAKVNHHKTKSNKRQQRQEQPRQATPPPRPATPPAEPAPPAADPPSAVREPSPTSTPPPQLPPKVTQVVDDKADVVPVPKPCSPVAQPPLPREEMEEDRLVAAMNEENKKLTASTKLADKVIVENDVTDNNNVEEKEKNSVTDVTLVVEPAPVIENAKPILKLNYKDDQWSPVNREGKKQYGRDFIMRLQNEPQSKKRPDNLPALEVLKDARQRPDIMRGGMAPRLGGDTLMPNFMKSSRSSGGGGRDSGRDSGHMKRSSLIGKQSKSSNKPMPIQVTLSLSEEVKLRECDTPWKPARAIEQNDLTEEEKKTESLNKKVRGVLNRLTPQKFNKLVGQVRSLPIDTPERLKGVIDLVFEKAVDEPGFSVAYAQMCFELGKMTVPPPKDKTDEKSDESKPEEQHKPFNFRMLLIQRCQVEFEKNPDDELKRGDRLKEIEMETDPEKKKEMMLQLEEDERRIRIKSVGNIRFIGELYKLRMLTAMIMLSCVEHLLRLNTEESLECLCKLLTTIGRSFEEDLQKNRESLREAMRNNASPEIISRIQGNVGDLNKYFDELQRLQKNKESKISNRVRFMIQDLIELRENRWVPRRDDSAPKTMDQIAKEAEREQLETNLAISAAGLHKAAGSGGRQDSRNSMDNRDRRRGGQDGWTHVSGNTRKQYVETNKLRVNPVDMELGLSLGSRDSYIWNKGSGSKSDERKQPVSGFGMTQNKFAALEEKPVSRSSSLKGSLPSGVEPRDARDPRDRPPSLRPSSQEEERNARNMQQYRSPDVARANPAPAGPPAMAGPAPLSEELNERATRTLVEEFVASKDYEEASRTLEEKFADSIKGNMVYFVFLYSLEKSGAVRRAASRLLAHFLQTGDLSLNHFFSGLKKFLGEVHDLLVDIPRLWEYLGEVLADVVAGGFSLEALVDALGPCDAGRRLFLAVLLRIIHAERLSTAKLPASVPALRAYVAPFTPYEDFLRENNLEFLENAPPAERSVDETRVTAELTRLLRGNAHFDAITQWVEANVGPASTESAFIRALTNAFLDVCLVRNKADVWKLDMDNLHRHINLLSRYVDNAGPRELQCLYTIQAKMNKLEHPKGILCDLCQFLSDQGAISSDSFKNWRACKDNQNVEGRGVCMASLTSFFTMIDEDEDETS